MVWGGILATSEQARVLSDKWGELLGAPLPDKPPLKKFHLSHCAAADGEFSNYNLGERDLTRRNFRQIIVESGAEGVACAVSKKAYDELMVGDARKHYGSAEQNAVGGCILFSLKRAAELGEKEVAVVFDIGRDIPEVRSILQRVRNTYEGPANLVHIGFVAMDEFAGLQAADTIATENYWNALDYLDGNREPRPHFKDFLSNAVTNGFILDRPSIEADIARFNRQKTSGERESFEMFPGWTARSA